MYEILVISGKGGSGKTSLSAGLACCAAGNAVLCDLDVDVPDLHILLDPVKQREQAFISGNEAVVRSEDCAGCGQCADLCQFDAVRMVDDHAVIDPLRCEGCGVCYSLCPAQAVDFPETHCGNWYVGSTRFGSFVHAQLFPGGENSGRLITLLKREAREIARNEGKQFILYDGSPGVGCPVISSLAGVQLAVAVVEPTPSGYSDFERIAGLCHHFKIPLALVINKCDLNAAEAEKFVTYSKRNNCPVIGRIPFSPDVTAAMLARRAVPETDSPLGQNFAAIWEQLLRLSRASGKRIEK